MDFQYKDGSAFDYGLTPNEYPWSTSEPNNDDDGQECVALVSDYDYKWSDFECDEDRRFICNSCVGKLNKYILNEQLMNWTSALASLCRMACTPSSCIQELTR